MFNKKRKLSFSDVQNRNDNMATPAAEYNALPSKILSSKNARGNIIANAHIRNRK